MTAALLAALLAGCDGEQPFDFGDGDTTGEGDGDGDGDGDGTSNDVLETGTALPPDAPEPGPNRGIARLESPNGTGGGLVSDVSYVAANDTFEVDGLGFDGANVYARGTAVAQVNGFAVYEADIVTEDFLTGNQIDQIVPYRAIYGVSTNTTTDGDPRSAFAIVRTGGYVDYGFGGFLYERNGAVVLPNSGQAIFSGDYAGIRVFEARGGLEYVEGDMTISIDFEDFNANDAVRGRIANRVIYDDSGNQIDAVPTPNVTFVIQEGAASIDANGEIAGELASFRVNDGGALEVYEEGTYYGLIAGDTTSGDGGEIVGIVVLESEDPRFDGVNAQETGGFILYR